MNWWNKLPDIWKIVVVLVSAITLVIGTYRSIDGFVAKKCDLDTQRKIHDRDIVELSTSFKRYQIRQEIRSNIKEQYEVEKKLRVAPTEQDRDRLDQLKQEKEELERDWQEIKKEQKGG